MGRRFGLGPLKRAAAPATLPRLFCKTKNVNFENVLLKNVVDTCLFIYLLIFLIQVVP